MRIAFSRHVQPPLLSLFRQSRIITLARCIHNRTYNKRKSLYDVLDVPHTATQDEIKTAYYELSLKYHPDVNKSEKSEHKFQEITNAYNVLRNLTSRRDYDKEIGTYFTMRGAKKKESGEKVLRLTDEMLEIDMRGIKQSQVFLSTIATLSTITCTPVRLMNVSVSDGGLQSHDMRVLQLLRQISSGTLAANTGLSMVTNVPSELIGGNFSAEAGRLGHLNLLVTSALPCCPFLPIPEYTRFNRLHIKGSTHSYKAVINADYIQNVMKPLVGKFGFDFNFDIRKRSYHPYWEGKICVESLPVHCLTPVVMKESGTVREITGWAFVAGAKPVRIAQVMAKQAHQMLKTQFPQVPLDIDSRRDRDCRSEGTGQGLMLIAKMSSGVLLSGTAIWEKGMAPVEVVSKAVQMLVNNVNSGSCIDRLLQEHAILLMALACGRSSIRMQRLTNRAKATMLAVETFTEVEFKISSKTPKTVLVECEGLGLLNEHVPPDDNLTYESADGELLSDDEYETSEELDSDNETVRSEEQDDELERMKKTI
ncbi:RNA 3'-terminal phosphate cyclase-like [Pocillopora verrucosa]|uniref:RNA 3'-terminal phosphate cyclase-like n=1 Tax=Pocillopora verrucosa TaxID=203993 RepID=UPI003342943C